MKLTRFLPVMLVASVLFIACGGGKNKEAAADANTEQLAVIDTVHAYICPMHCEESGSMEPGVCKVCGMDLVKNPDYKGATTSISTDTTAVADTAANMHDDHEGHNH